MGQQQLIIVLVGVIVVGIAIMVALSMFSGASVEATRNAIISDLGTYAQRARSYYWRPRTLGGGDRSFSNITLSAITSVAENELARFYIEAATQDCVIIVGVGKRISGNDSIRVSMTVNEKTNTLKIIN